MHANNYQNFYTILNILIFLNFVSTQHSFSIYLQQLPRIVPNFYMYSICLSISCTLNSQSLNITMKKIYENDSWAPLCYTSRTRTNNIYICKKLKYLWIGKEINLSSKEKRRKKKNSNKMRGKELIIYVWVCVCVCKKLKYLWIVAVDFYHENWCLLEYYDFTC